MSGVAMQDPPRIGREVRLPIHVRRGVARRLRRTWDVWMYTQALVERLGIVTGGFSVKLHQGRVVEVAIDMR